MNRFDSSVPEVKCTVTNKDELNQIPSSVTHLEIASNCCNESDLTELDLSHCLWLNRLVIGSNSLQNVTKIDAHNCVHLREVIVGEGSLRMIQEYLR